MGFQVSPGVVTNEIDLTNVIPAVATSIGGLVGRFQWGPVNSIKLVTSEADLAAKFGKPYSASGKDFLVASQFLAYSNALKVVRVEDSATATNANGWIDVGATTSAPVFIANEDVVDEGSVVLSTGGEIIARYPGAMGNNLRVVVLDNGNFDTAAIDDDVAAASSLFDSIPGANEYHIVVFDEAGSFTGVAGSVLESYSFLSDTPGTKSETGANIFYQDVINQQSKYIYIGDTAQLIAGNVLLSGGVDGTLTPAIRNAGWDLFLDENVDVSLLIPSAETTEALYVIQNIAEVRKDCVALISAAESDVVTSTDKLSDIKTFRNALASSSYAMMDANWKYIYNKYYDRFEWAPLNADVAGLLARTEQDRDAWWSPAGYNRGIIKNVVRLAWDPTKASRDELYKVGINPVINEPGIGPVLFGDKTLLSRPSAFDRINVRRLFIVLEKAIATASKYQLFELNDQFTRAQFVATVEPFLRDVQGRRGVTDFQVVCDETNNTGEVIDNNRFVGDIYIKPARSINFITLNFVSVRSGVEFSEIVGNF